MSKTFGSGSLPPLIFLNLVGWYLKNLCPTFFGGDSPELLTAGYNLGIAHPTGYPLFTLFLKLAQLIPLGSPAWRGNFLNCLLGGITALIVFLIIKKYAVKTFPAFFCMILFAFSLTFFHEALISRVYLTNLFFSALVIYLLSFESLACLFPAAFLIGLGFTNHYFILLLIPPFCISLYLLRPIKIKHLLIIPGVFILGSAVYLYLPLRASQRPFPNWETPYRFDYFLNALTQTSYRFKMASRESGEALILLGKVGRSFLYELYLVGTLLSVYGLALSWTKRKLTIWNSLLLVILGNLVMVIFYGSATEFYTLYFMPTYLAGAIYLGLGLASLYQWGSKLKIFTVFSWFVVVLLLIDVAYNLGGYVSERHNYLFYDYAQNLMKLQEKDSRFIVRSDYAFSLWYLKKVENRREDIFLLNYPVNDWYLRELIPKHPELLPLARKSPTAREFLNNYLQLHHESYQIYTAFIQPEKIPAPYTLERNLVLDRLISASTVTAAKLTFQPHLKYWRLRLKSSQSSLRPAEKKLFNAYADFFSRVNITSGLDRKLKGFDY